MSVTRAERVMSRRIIRQLIRLDSSEVAFTRVEMLDDGEGGVKKGAKRTLDPQKVTIVPFKRRFVDGVLVTDFGQVEGQSRMLLGEVGLDIEKGDTFTWRGGKYTVVEFEDILNDIHTIARVEYSPEEDVHDRL